MRNKFLVVLRTAKFLAQYFSKKFLFVLKKRLPSIKKLYGHSFQAMHLKKMDSFDYFFNFSSELLIFGLVLIMVVLNVASFGIFGFHKEKITDQSLAAKFLSLHSQLNNKLYVHNSAVKTTVIAGNNFAPTAFASDEGLTPINSQTTGDANSSTTNFDSVITKPLDDPKDLLQNNITVYQSQSGDTLSSIAKKFGISTNTLAWSNNLSPSQTIKNGWFFIISPQDKVIIHKTTASDSIPGLARKYGVSEDTIIAKNGLEDAGDIDPGVYLYIPGGNVQEAPKPTPAKPGKKGSGGNSGFNLREVGNVFPYGQCTWYVATQVNISWRGNAKDWLKNASAAGKTVTKEAGAGRIAVTPDSRYGHVSMVRAVYGNGTVLLEDYNYSGRKQHGTHIENIDRVRGFIVP